MFKCQVTKKNSKLGEKLNRIVIQTRTKIYTQKIWDEGEAVEIETGRGYEIVKEIMASDEGVRRYNQAVEDGTVDEFIRKL